MSCCWGVSWLLLILLVGLGFIVVINWKLVGYVVFFEVWDICILLVLRGFCSIFNVFCLNLGNLFRNRMLWWVSEILSGIGCEFLLVRVIVEFVWWGECMFCVLKFVGLMVLFFIECIVVIFNVFCFDNGGSKLSRWLVKRFFFVFWGFIISRLCVFVVVMIRVCLVCVWFIMLF